MADRTVDLVIRAKNEASAVLQQITASLQAFTTAQSGVVSGSGNTGSALEKLVSGLAGLKGQIDALKDFGRVTAEMDRLGKAAQALGEDAGKASVEANRLAAEVAAVERRYASATERTRAATAAVKEQTAAVEQNVRAQRSIDQQLAATNARIEAFDAKARNRPARADGTILTNSEQDARTQLEARSAALESLAGTQAVRTDEAVAALGPLQAEERAASAASGALANQMAGLRKELGASAAQADKLAGSYALVIGQSEELAAAAGKVGDRLGVDVTKAEAYAQALAKIAGAQQSVQLAIERNQAAQAAEGRQGENLTAFRSAIKREDVSGQAAALRDQRYRVDAAERAREIANQRATAAGRLRAQNPDEENTQLFNVTRLDLDTAERTLEKEKKTLADIKNLHGEFRAEVSAQAAAMESARKAAGQKEGDAILAAMSKIIAEQEKAQGILDAEEEKRQEEIRQRAVKAAQERLKAAQGNLQANPPVTPQASGQFAPGAAAEQAGNYRAAVAALAALTVAEGEAAAATKTAAAAAVEQGASGKAVSEAIRNEVAAHEAATAAVKAQAASLDAYRAAASAARDATAKEAAALKQFNEAFQSGNATQLGVVNLRTAMAEREAAVNAAQRQIASLRQVNDASRQAAEAGRALAEAQAREAVEAEHLEAMQQRVIAAKRAHAAATKQLKEAEEQAAAATRSHSEVLGGVAGQISSVIATYVGLYQAIDALKSAFQAATDYEAAQVRVTQALDQGNTAGAAAFQHIIDKATALKIPVLEAADSYGKFLAAVKGTAIEGEQSTRIFDSFLTISRGFKLDSESIQRGTIALRDLAATGQVSLRYLNQFDRAVPVGLLSELAKAAGYGAGEIGKFLKAVHDGQVGLETLAPALEAVQARVENNLPTALKTSQSALVAFQNAYLQAQLSFTSGPFLQAAVDGLNALTETLKSDAGRQGLRDLGSLVGLLTRGIAAAIPYARELVAVLAGFAALKLTAWVAGFEGIVPLLGSVGNAFKVMRAEQVAFAAAAEAEAAAVAAGEVAIGAAAAGAAAPVGLLGTALSVLTGPVGIAVALAAGALAFIEWGSSASKASNAAGDFNSVLGDLKTQADQAASGVDRMTASTKALTAANLDKSILSMRDAIAETSAELTKFSNGPVQSLRIGAILRGDNDLDQQLGYIRAYIAELLDGSRSVDTFSSDFEKLYAAMKDPEAAKALLDTKDALEKYVDQTKKLAAAAQATGGKSNLAGVAEDAAKSKTALEEIQGALKGDTQGISEAARLTEEWQKAMDNLKGVFPTIKDNLKDISDQAKIAAANFAAIRLDESLSKADGMGGGIGGIGPYKSTNFDATQLAISEGQQKILQDKFSKLPGFNEQIENLGARVFNFESGGKPGAQSGSGAVGTGQFLASTFIDQFKKAFGNDTGLSNQQIANLRTNDALSRQLGKQYLVEQGTALAGVGNKPDFNFEGRAYLGYNAGIPAAQRLLNADPNSSASAAVGKTVYENNKALYTGTVQQALDRIEKIVGGGAKLNSKGQTSLENRDEQVTKIFDKSVRDLESKTKAAGDGKDNDKKGQYVAAAGQKFTDEALAKNSEAEKKEVKELTAEQKKQLEIIKQKAAAEYQATHKDEDEKAKLEELNTLVERRKTALDELHNAEKKGDTSAITQYKNKVKELEEQIKKVIPEAKKMVDALGDQKGTLKLEQVNEKLNEVDKSADETGKTIANDFAGDAMSALDGFVSDITKGKNAMDALKNAFLKFASSFLKQIAEMILKKALLGAIGGNPDSKGSAQSGGIFSGLGGMIGGGGGGGGFGGIFGMLGGLFHTGGTVGTMPALSRRVDPAWFADAPRFHGGGYPGLKPDEVPIIAQKGERVMSRSEVNSNSRDTAGAPQPRPQRNIFVMGDSEVAAAMAGSHGEEVTLSHIRRNASTVGKMVKGG